MIYTLLQGAAFLWFVQQVNDAYNSWINRQHVPKMFWLSAGASFFSGILTWTALFFMVYVLEYILQHQ